MTCALTLSCCTSSHDESHAKRVIHRSGADSVCELNELNRSEGTSFPTLLDDDGGRSHESDATAVYDGAGRFDQAER